MNISSPYVISTHDLGRSPGSLREIDREVPAPADVGTAVISVAPGSPIHLGLRLQAVMDGILVDGSVAAGAVGQCVRCLRETGHELRVELAELYLYPGARARAIAEGDEEAEELRELDGELLDLEPALRDSLVLAMPFRPLCGQDCPGLCPECGIRLADAPGDHGHETIDPRWAALSALTGGAPGPRESADPGGTADVSPGEETGPSSQAQEG